MLLPAFPYLAELQHFQSRFQSRSAKEGTAMTRTTRHSKRHVLICKASWSKEAERTDAQELRIPHQMLADGTVNSDNQQC